MHVPRTSALAFLLATAAAAHVATAQQLGTIEVGAFAHYTSVTNDAQLGSHTTGFGARAGVFVFKYLEGEIEYGRGTVKTGGIRYSEDAWYPIRIMGTANIPLGERTKLLLGAGIVDTYKGNITYNEFEEGMSFLGGVRVCFGDAWSVRPELMLDKLPSPEWLQRNYLYRPPGNPTSSRLGFRIGISRFIGRGSHSCVTTPRQAPPPPPPVVTAPPPPPPMAPTATLSASPRRITAGDATTLNWNSANATSCTSSWMSGNATSGAQSVSPITTTTYSTTCSGAGGTTSASVTIEVAQPAPPPPPPPPAPVRREPPREFFRLSGVFFDFDKSTIKPAGRVKLDSAVMILNQNPDARIEIQGHTDSVGTREYNVGLSERRANAVRDYLVSKGIAASRLVTRGYGETQPVASNSTKEGRAENRRVVFIELRD